MTASALAIIPTYCTRSGDIEMLDATLRSLRAKTPDDRCDIARGGRRVAD
jgi:hypothetical protein